MEVTGGSVLSRCFATVLPALRNHIVIQQQKRRKRRYERDTRARTVTGRRPVGRLQGQARRPFVCRPQARRPQAEVIDVELLVVWARREQRAGEIVDGPVGLEAAEAAAAGMARRRVSTCGCAAVERVLELGADIRAGVPGGVSGPGCSGDAEKVWAAVVGLAGECSRLARMHGRLGSRPD